MRATEAACSRRPFRNVTDCGIALRAFRAHMVELAADETLDDATRRAAAATLDGINNFSVDKPTFLYRLETAPGYVDHVDSPPIRRLLGFNCSV